MFTTGFDRFVCPADTITCEVDGLVFQTREFPSVAATNSFLSLNQDWGALAQDPPFGDNPRRVRAARKDDKGTKPCQP